MDPPTAPSGQEMPHNDFQSALANLRTTHAPSASSNRDASGGLPPISTPPGNVPAQSGSSSVPVKPVNRPAASKNAIVHSVLQRRNPILPLIRNVGLEIGDITVDYQVGAHNGVLFLSLKYHRLHPEYIHTRIEKMRHAYSLRVLLILCDINEHQQPLRELSKIAIVNEMTMLVAFSNEEAAQYLTTLKAYEHKSADSLKEKVHQTYRSQLEHALTSGRKVNKSNAEAIAAQFGSFANIARQSNHTLSSVKGLGKVKIVSLLDAFNKPFVAGGVETAEPVNTLISHAAEDQAARSGGITGGRSDPDDSQVTVDAEDRAAVGTENAAVADLGDSRVATDEVFADPLDDNSDEEEEGDDNDDDDQHDHEDNDGEPARKRPRT